MSIILWFLFAFVHSKNCTHWRIRYNWKDLPENVQTDYLATLHLLHTTSDIYNSLAWRHNKYKHTWHQSAFFFPVHRQLLVELDQALLKWNAHVVSVPYWEWTRDAAVPALSLVWERFDRPGPGCVKEGVIDWVTTPRPHCLKRGIDAQGPEEGTLIDTALLRYLIENTSTLGEFSEVIENGPHADFHVHVGGQGGDLSRMYSNNDPLFYLHHRFTLKPAFILCSFVDKIFDTWLQIHPRQKFRGPRAYNDPDAGMVTERDMLPAGFHRRYRISSLLSSTAMCYLYAPNGSPYRGPTTRDPRLFQNVRDLGSDERVTAPPHPLPRSYRNMLNISDTRYKRLWSTLMHAYTSTRQ